MPQPQTLSIEELKKQIELSKKVIMRNMKFANPLGKINIDYSQMVFNLNKDIIELNKRLPEDSNEKMKEIEYSSIYDLYDKINPTKPTGGRRKSRRMNKSRRRMKKSRRRVRM
jgi:hypothetical protein